MTLRTDRVGDLLRGELATILLREIRDPRVAGLATVSGVTVSRDLGHAVVRISVLGDEETRQQSVEALERAKGFIRSLLARRVRLRTIPNLVFRLDRGPEHSQRISEILENLNEPGEGT